MSSGRTFGEVLRDFALAIVSIVLMVMGICFLACIAIMDIFRLIFTKIKKVVWE
jgi:hypothetical protein